MDINQIAQICLYGVLRGFVYSIMALGLTLIFGTMKIVNLAHGILCILGAYLAFSLIDLGLDPYFSMLLLLPLFFIIGVCLYFGIFQKTRDPNSSTVSSFGLLIAIQTLIMIIWNPTPKMAHSYFSDILVPIGVVSLSSSRIVLSALCIFTAFIVHLLLKKTWIGIAIRSTSEDAETSSIMGINVKKVNCIAFSIGLMLACLAGVAYGTNYAFDPFVGLSLSFKGFIVLTLAGIGSTLGLLVTGPFLGVIEGIVGFQLGLGWTDVISYLMIIILLITKPTGIFGGKKI
jgi:branched-chain amino acid transport system permease protein